MAGAGQKRNDKVVTYACAALLAACLIPAIALALPPSPPISLTATAGSAQPQIAELVWPTSTDPEVVGYNIYAAVDADGPYQLMVQSTETSASFTSGLPGMLYYFRVTAYNAAGDESAPVTAGPVASTWSYSPHMSVATTTRRCAECHSPHQASGTLLYRWEAGASGSVVMCLTCHNGRNENTADVASGTRDSFTLASGHAFEPTSTETHPASIHGCETCHAVHGSSDATRRIPASSVNGTDVASAGPELCLACHTKNTDWYGDNYPSTSSPTRDATGYPVAGTWPGPATYSSPTANAHRLIPETTQSPTAGQPVRRAEGDCLYCHAAHRGSNAYDSLLTTFAPPSTSTLASDQADGTYAASCFACHGSTVPDGFSAPMTNIKQFATAAGGAGGHSIVTSGGTLPAGSPLPCYECHNPHGSSRGNKSLISDALGTGLETSSAAGVREFCFSCHTTADTVRGWDSEAATFTAVSTTETVVGLRRDGVSTDTTNALLLPSLLSSGTVGHAQADTDSCYDCHGDAYTAGGTNVHNPSADGSFSGAHLSAPFAGLLRIAVDTHAFSTVSDYNDTAMTGCTNSGLGCHGDDTARGSFATYHPSTGCSTGACHTSPSKAVYAGNHECVSCHDGSFDGAPAEVMTATSTLNRHYGEATHTAGAPVDTVKGSALGTVSATCVDCHNPASVGGLGALYGQHQGLPAPYGETTCSGCHNSSGAVTRVVATGWTTRRCDECHSSSTMPKAAQHGSTAPAVSGSSSVGCGDSGCHGTWNLHELHDGKPSGVVSTCALSGCHDYSKQGLKPTYTTCGADGACHTDKADGSHGAVATHTFTSASDYDNTVITGCTNSGVGCHGFETSYGSFAVYHPATGCVSGVCHTSPSKTAYSGDHECLNCHDGSFENAPQTSPLLSNSGVGHYDEAKHTAFGLDTTVSAGGSASATCSDCHNPLNPAPTTFDPVDALFNQHQGLPGPYVNTGCKDCHNKNVHVASVIRDKWPTRQCDACHNSIMLPLLEQHGTAPPVIVPSAAGTREGMSCDAVGCHDQGDIHAIHRDAASCAVSGCHDFSKQAKLPDGSSCGTAGTCHTTADPHN